MIKLTQEKNVLSKTVAQQDDEDGQNDGHEYGGNGQYPVRIHIDAWGNKSRIVPINNLNKKYFSHHLFISMAKVYCDVHTTEALTIGYSGTHFTDKSRVEAVFQKVGFGLELIATGFVICEIHRVNSSARIVTFL